MKQYCLNTHLNKKSLDYRGIQRLKDLNKKNVSTIISAPWIYTSNNDSELLFNLFLSN